MPDKAFIIPHILQHHLEELQFLWGQHQRALKSPDYKFRDLIWLEERIAANVDGLLVAGEEAVPLLEEALLADDPRVSFSAAYTLVRMDNEAGTQKVMTAFLQSKEKQLDGIRAALCHSPIDQCIDQLRKAFASSPAANAVAAAEVLASHRKLEASPSRLTELHKDENPAVRQSAWRVMALLGSTPAG